jgi:hypothetical protein
MKRPRVSDQGRRTLTDAVRVSVAAFLRSIADGLDGDRRR